MSTRWVAACRCSRTSRTPCSDRGASGTAVRMPADGRNCPLRRPTELTRPPGGSRSCRSPAKRGGAGTVPQTSQTGCLFPIFTSRSPESTGRSEGPRPQPASCSEGASYSRMDAVADEISGSSPHVPRSASRPLSFEGAAFGDGLERRNQELPEFVNHRQERQLHVGEPVPT